VKRSHGDETLGGRGSYRALSRRVFTTLFFALDQDFIGTLFALTGILAIIMSIIIIDGILCLYRLRTSPCGKVGLWGQ
jgi:hypothetical protein